MSTIIIPVYAARAIESARAAEEAALKAAYAVDDDALVNYAAAINAAVVALAVAKAARVRGRGEGDKMMMKNRTAALERYEEQLTDLRHRASGVHWLLSETHRQMDGIRAALTELDKTLGEVIDPDLPEEEVQK